MPALRRDGGGRRAPAAVGSRAWHRSLGRLPAEAKPARPRRSAV